MPDPAPVAAPVVLPAPPDITSADITPSAAPVVPSFEVPNSDAGDPTVVTSPTDPTAPATASDLQNLAGVFGVDPAVAGDPSQTAAALTPIINMLAEAGKAKSAVSPLPASYQPAVFNQQAAPAPAPSTPAQPAADPVVDFTISEEDLADAPPGVAKALQALASRQQKAYEQAVAQTKAAQAQAEQIQQGQLLQNQQQAAYYEQQVESRSNAYLDSLKSPTYGVGANRTLMQTIATQNVTNAAQDIIRGLQSYGGNIPTIENVMYAAILSVGGQVPGVPAQVAAPLPAGLPPGGAQQPGVGAPAVGRVKPNGSAGAGGQLMSDPKYMEGARAIMAR